MAIGKPDKETKIIEDKQKTISKEIPIEKTSNEQETLQVDFTDEEDANGFAGAQTKPAKKDEQTIPDNKSADEIKKEIDEYETSKSGKLEYKDLKQTAEFLINLLDTALSTAFNLFARDTSITAYTLPAPNKKLLIEQLALILAKYQSKFKIEFMFFMGLIVMYAPMAIAASKSRKLRGKAKQIVPERKPNEPLFKHKENTEPPIEIEKQSELPIKEEIRVPLKRGQGKQPKVAK